MIATYLLRDDFEELGVGEEYAEGVIDELRAVKGVELAMTVREPPVPDGPRAACRCARRATRFDVSAIARQRSGGGHKRAAGFSSDESIEEIIEFVRARVRAMPPRALEPRGLILVDKPAGPVVVPGDRRDPPPDRARGPATRARSTRSRPGSCSCCPARQRRLAPWLVGLDKRYLTEVDLSARTSTGDPEGEVVEQLEPPDAGGARGAARGPARRGRAADPGRLGGEDRRRARLPAAPARRGGRDAGAALAGRRARRCIALRRRRRDASTCASARGRTSARSRTRSAATAGRCGAPRSGRSRSRTPTTSGSCPPAEALPFLPAVEVDADEAAAIRAGRTHAPADTRTLLDGELVAVGRVVMPAEGRALGRGARARATARSRSGPSTASTSATGA